MAKKVIATSIGLFKIFCKTIDNNIVDTGKAKNTNKFIIVFLLYDYLYII